MSSPASHHDESHVDLVHLHALRALLPGEAAAAETRIASCAECRRELDTLRPIVAAFVDWPTNILRPATSLWDRLAQKIAADTGRRPEPEPAARPALPEWEEVAPGISVRMLSNDAHRQRVTMLVRLAADTTYPPHRHEGPEELHLLDGELWIGDRLLRPGDYNYGEPGAVDRRVYTETGCTCVLITSSRDELL